MSKRWSRRLPPVLDRVSLTLEPGSHTVVLGSNGSGKSTLLATIARTLQPTSGRVTTPWPIAYTPERVPALLPFSATEYLAHMGRIRGLKSAEAIGRAEELCDLFGLNPGPDVPFEDLSKGNRQKVMLAQAFLAQVVTLVLDEPTSGLDDGAIVALARLISEACKSGTAVISSAQRMPDWTVPGSVLHISEGHLAVASEISPTIGYATILARSPTALELGQDVVEGVQVRGVHSDGLVVLRVLSQGVDRSLLALLQQGWSIHSVLPSLERDVP